MLTEESFKEALRRSDAGFTWEGAAALYEYLGLPAEEDADLIALARDYREDSFEYIAVEHGLLDPEGLEEELDDAQYQLEELELDPDADPSAIEAALDAVYEAQEAWDSYELDEASVLEFLESVTTIVDTTDTWGTVVYQRF